MNPNLVRKKNVIYDSNSCILLCYMMSLCTYWCVVLNRHTQALMISSKVRDSQPSQCVSVCAHDSRSRLELKESEAKATLLSKRNKVQ